ncbi:MULTISPECIES: LysR family transcriptional regulator [unclassified Bacillus (in: firmicutes)]|uniref:LysR family transcriptional regulator n=1 Tax=unclassified Bacillus (in: firmicutes) TaxID=185979 RepID=UPI0008F08A7E|nr:MULTISPECIES: LysR family transcriptional regulator [unclassified Bacillus (in: firmicutes)]SFA90547.1 DNA-binding transcriptional regulator, LysR family [Bacillus sp. UNCCL13]SFQ85293.1 DNA-binding transcriptional regulator, LysR family [Bacillus sp. cl95]
MTLLQYKVFETIVDTGSFTKAGDKLGMTQSAISHAIKGLEVELSLNLLNRGRSGISLTSEGERIIHYVREILNLSELLNQEAGNLNGLKVGSIRIGTFPSVSAHLLPAIIEKFQTNYPAIQVEFHEGGYNELMQMLSSGVIDVSFSTSETSGNLDFIPLLDDHLKIILPENHPLKNYKVLSIHNIADEPFIMPKAGCDELIKELFKKNKLQPKVYWEIGDNQTIINMVKRNLGISIVPELILSIEKELNIISLEENTFRTIGLSVPSLERKSPAVEAFINLAKAMIQKDK